jgi:hypothetical protein
MRMLVSLFLAVGLSLCVGGTARAHPCFVGNWTAPLPCPGLAEYNFGPADFIGGGVWVGPLTHVVAGCTVATGTYELRMWSDTQGTVSIREGVGISTIVGIVDLRERTFEYIGTMYRKN